MASAKRPLRLVEEAKGGLTLRNTPLLRTPAGSRMTALPRSIAARDVDRRRRWRVPIQPGSGGLRVKAPSPPASAACGRTSRPPGGPTDALEAELPHLAPLRFEVSSSSFDDPSRNRFRFRLDGQDIDWSPWTLETRKDYTNLGPGVYRFRVETRDVYGRVGDAGRESRSWFRHPGI